VNREHQAAACPGKRPPALQSVSLALAAPSPVSGLPSVRHEGSSVPPQGVQPVLFPVRVVCRDPPLCLCPSHRTVLVRRASPCPPPPPGIATVYVFIGHPAWRASPSPRTLDKCHAHSRQTTHNPRVLSTALIMSAMTVRLAIMYVVCGKLFPPSAKVGSAQWAPRMRIRPFWVRADFEVAPVPTAPLEQAHINGGGSGGWCMGLPHPHLLTTTPATPIITFTTTTNTAPASSINRQEHHRHNHNDRNHSHRFTAVIFTWCRASAPLLPGLWVAQSMCDARPHPHACGLFVRNPRPSAVKDLCCRLGMSSPAVRFRVCVRVPALRCRRQAHCCHQGEACRRTADLPGRRQVTCHPVMHM
jgi:hypothetical protein